MFAPQSCHFDLYSWDLFMIGSLFYCDFRYHCFLFYVINCEHFLLSVNLTYVTVTFFIASCSLAVSVNHMGKSTLERHETLTCLLIQCVIMTDVGEICHLC